MDAAAPSFRIETLSTSSVLRPSNVNLSLTTPSITYNGLELLNVPTARTRMLDSRPGVPAFCVIAAPDTRPANAFERLSAGTSLNSSLVTDVTDPVTAARFWTRYPVATTAPNWTASWASWKSAVIVSPPFTVTGRVAGE